MFLPLFRLRQNQRDMPQQRGFAAARTANNHKIVRGGMFFWLQIRPDITPCQWLHDIERNNGPGRQFRGRADQRLHKHMLKPQGKSPYRAQSLHIKVAALAYDMLKDIFCGSLQ